MEALRHIDLKGVLCNQVSDLPKNFAESLHILGLLHDKRWKIKYRFFSSMFVLVIVPSTVFGSSYSGCYGISGIPS